jgi:uncharacterized protein (DUF4415 family)
MRDEYDFSESKRGAIIKSAKERITIRLDPSILDWFRDRVRDGGNYQTLINEALRVHVGKAGRPVDAKTLRRVLREELQRAG